MQYICLTFVASLKRVTDEELLSESTSQCRPYFLSLRKLAHAIHSIFSSVKNDNFLLKFYIFLIFAENIDCGYTLEPSRRSKNKEKIGTPLQIPVLLHLSGV